MTGQAPRFIYLHGFASSPGSTKAKAFRAWGERHGISVDVLDLRVPSFEHLLFSAMEARVKEAIDAAGGARARAVLIGSSLGGLTAARVAEADPRVCALFLMAPAFELASRWEARIGKQAWSTWRTSGFLEVDDYASRQKARVHWGFVDELAQIDAARGAFSDVRVPTRIVHGTRDSVVDIELSRAWSKGKRFVELVELDDGHELGASIPRILEEADAFFGPFLGGSRRRG
ncbi:MAG TPA: YqiA/YcfP family alpha/beta fold hydrolase [Labilithrix sp.]|nr:YqiA/YcfP family alpha/beta fold hydrolase [Labilithrix sp.]